MTVAQLYNSVAQLGFESSLEDDERFIYAANRALLQVNALRPDKSIYIINHKTISNQVNDATFEPVEKIDELFFFATNVKSYYFEADGNGILWIEKHELGEWVKIGMVELSGQNAFKAYRGFIKQDGDFTDGSIRLHFTGEYLYSVKCVAMYSCLYSESEADIPAYEAFVRYDVGALVSDFLALSSPPIEENLNMRLNQGYDIENGRVVLLPYDTQGTFKIVYNRKPKTIENSGEAASDNAVIDIDEDLCALLPLLVASYIWVDDEPEKAQYYLMLYREQSAKIEEKTYNVTPTFIKNINNW